MITAEGIHKSFGKNHVLKGIDLTLEKGKITAILGPNGSGKTTMMKCILGMVVPQQGTLRVAGRPVLGEWEYRKDIGYLPQIARFPENLRVKELIDMVRDIRGNYSGEQELIRHFGLEGYLDKPLRTLSGGTRQKINIVLAFMFDCSCYILDEPTAGLDPVALIRFKELLEKEKARGKAILLTTHIINLVEEVADEIVFLLEGRIFYRGTLDGLKALEGESNFKLEQAIANILLRQNYD